MKNKFKHKIRIWALLSIVTLKQVRLIVWVTLLVAMVGVINYEGEIVIIANPTKFIKGLNALINQVLITYITGCFLYLLFELLNRTKKKIAVYVSVVNNVMLITERTEYLLNEIGKTNIKDKNDFDLNSDTFREYCKKIDIDIQKVNVWFYPEYTFRQFVVRSCREIKSAADEILSYSELFDEKWAYSLSRITDLSDKLIRALDIRFEKPTIESYYLWALYAESRRLELLIKKYDKDYFRLERMNSEAFHPIGLEYRVERRKG
jgi:hypothetical protein